MRKVDFLQHGEVMPLAEAEGRGRPFADTVDGQHRRRLEGRGVKGAGRMALMMLGKQQSALEVLHLDPGVGVCGDLFQLLAQEAFLEQLLLHPDRHGGAERLEAFRREGEIGLQEALELQERLVVERDMVDLGQRQPAFRQAVAHRLVRKAAVMLDPGEALLLRRRDDPAVHHQGGRAVVIKSRHTEYTHSFFPLSLASTDAGTSTCLEPLNLVRAPQA